MFARVMGVVSPCVFLASSIVWGLSTGHPVTVVFLLCWALRRRLCRFARGVGQPAALLSA